MVTLSLMIQDVWLFLDLSCPIKFVSCSLSWVKSIHGLLKSVIILPWICFSFPFSYWDFQLKEVSKFRGHYILNDSPMLLCTDFSSFFLQSNLVCGSVLRALVERLAFISKQIKPIPGFDFSSKANVEGEVQLVEEGVSSEVKRRGAERSYVLFRANWQGSG